MYSPRHLSLCGLFGSKHTDVPVPIVYCDLEDHGAYCLITECIKGEGMSKDSQRV